jgi:hypothetical protein
MTPKVNTSGNNPIDIGSSIRAIVEKCDGKVMADGSAMVKCPAHDDTNPSLHVTDDNGQLLLNCFAGCPQETVIQAMKDKGLWPSKNGNRTLRARGLWPISNGDSPFQNLPPGIPLRWYGAGYVRHWIYRDGQGQVIGYVARYEGQDGKQVIPFFKQNGTAWKSGAAPAPRPLYGLHELVKAPETPVLMSEGEKATDAAQRLMAKDYVCMTWPGGSKAVNQADWSPMAGRDVVVWPDADDPGRKAAQAVAQLCQRAGAKSVVVVDPPSDVADGWDLADAREQGWTGDQVREWIDQHSQQGAAEQDSQEAEPKKSQAAILIELAADAELFESAGDDIVFATIPVNEHKETWPVRAKPFKRWLSGRFYGMQGKPPGNQAIHDALGVLEAKAQFEGIPQSVHARIAQHKNAIYIDLCDSMWRVIKITSQRWNIESKSPVKFRRAAGMLPLPDPVPGGSLNDLSPLLNGRGGKSPAPEYLRPDQILLWL